jgi:hypothetical protein
MWQDWFFAISNLGYTVAMLPSCWNPKTEIPWRTSSLTALLMFGGGLTYLTLGMNFAGAAQFLGGIPWVYIFFCRRIR